jgi:alpha/beta superfamily hydrolase
MEEVRALNDLQGQGIFDILEPTFVIFSALLSKPENKAAILAIHSTTESYGPHPRQKLDIYKAPNDSKDTPILVFFYEGGLTMGDKISPKFNLVYHNLGAFFASRGITTIIPDYRRVNSPFGGEDAVFPSGAENVSLALKWVENFNTSSKRNVFIMGNSAGGVHISTFLFEDDSRVITNSNLQDTHIHDDTINSLTRLDTSFPSPPPTIPNTPCLYSSTVNARALSLIPNIDSPNEVLNI